MNKSNYKYMILLCFSVGSASAFAQDWPTKPVRIVTGSSGTTGDILSRFLSQRLNERWGKPVIVENRTGGGIVSAELVKHATPDGYTLHMAQQSSFVAAVSLYKKLAYDPVKDFAPLTLVARVPQMLIANPSFPVANVKELIAYAKARPGAVNYSSGGPTTTGNLTFALLNSTAGIQLVHIPYKGVSVATTAVMSGEVQLAMVPVAVALTQVSAGKVKAFAITSAQRFSGAPNVPTIAEAGLPGFEATTWFGMVAPAQLPAALVRKLNTDLVEILSTPQTRERLVRQGAEPTPGTPAEFTAFLKDEIVKWGKVIREAGLKAQ